MYQTLIKKCFFSQAPKGGRLIVWDNSKALYTFTESPVVKFSPTVNSHHAFVTQDGKLYTCGDNTHGQLGRKDEKGTAVPKKVDFFEKYNLKVIDVAVGENHTLALVEGGEVWSFGRGNRNVLLFLRPFINTMGPLGHPDKADHHLPKKIATFNGLPQITDITSGRFFNTAVNEKGQVYNWGRGEYSVFGNGGNSNKQIPTLNDHFEYLRESEGLTIKKVQSRNNYTVALMSDGYIYGWGSNDEGQMGINETGGEMYETYFYPTKICIEDFGDKKIVDFEISENVLILKLSDGNIYWCGKKAAFKPEKVVLPSNSQPQIIGASNGSFAVTAGDKIYARFGFLGNRSNLIKSQTEDVHTALKEVSISAAFDGAQRVLKLGGGTKVSYAIVE